jgi:hypothetical protein
MKADLTPDLVNLIAITGRLLTCIRTHCSDLQIKDPKAPAGLQTVREYAQAANNLSAFGHEMMLYATAAKPDAAPVVESCDRLIREFEGVKKQVMNRGSIRDFMVFGESTACLEDIRGKLVKSPVPA